MDLIIKKFPDNLHNAFKSVAYGQGVSMKDFIFKVLREDKEISLIEKRLNDKEVEKK